MKPGKLWGGRFTREVDRAMEAFSASIGFDWQLYEVDIRGSIAYAQALAKAGVLTRDEAETLVSGLQEVLADFCGGRFAS